MRPAHWMLLLSSLMFLTSLWFVLAGATCQYIAVLDVITTS